MPECLLTECASRSDETRLCPGHRHRVTGDLAAIPGLYVRLTLELRPSGASIAEHVSGTRTPPTALSLPVFAACEDFADVLWAWGTLARSKRLRIESRASGEIRQAQKVRRGHQHLVRHGHLLCASDYAADYAESLHRLVLRAHRLLKNDTLVHRLPAPCPACDLRTLIRRDGSDRVQCAACAASWDESEYQRLVRVLTWTLSQGIHTHPDAVGVSA